MIQNIHRTRVVSAVFLALATSNFVVATPFIPYKPTVNISQDAPTLRTENFFTGPCCIQDMPQSPVLKNFKPMNCYKSLREKFPTDLKPYTGCLLVLLLCKVVL